MYTAGELIKMNDSSIHYQLWNDQIACLLVHHNDIITGVPMSGASVFSFALVRRGCLTVDYNGQLLELKKNDLHTYAPGMPNEMIHITNDYEGYCLIIDEKLINETPLIRHFIKAAYFPIAEFSKPLMTLSDEQADLLANLLQIIRHHIIRPSAFQQEVLLNLCEVFSIDLLNIQSIQVEHLRIPTRYKEIFAAFLQLIPSNFIEHRDLAYYANQLNITTTYLSRIVKQISGRTVMSFIEHSLMIEACQRLKATEVSITQLAYDLHFSDQASFTKFFTRIRGLSPRDFRKTF